jgi:sterol desaturase/sphingolipid hydroxylase (fatty acid hydroxylase superfamily)
MLNEQFLISGLLLFFKYVLALPLTLFITFEIIPLFFSEKSTIVKNLPDLFKYHIYRGILIRIMGIIIIISFSLVPFKKNWVDISFFSLFSQVIILYFFVEFFIYLGHMLVHKYKIPILSKAHSFHHETKEDLQWVNSSKEHIFVIFLFLLIFSFIFYILFKSSDTAKILVSFVFLAFNAFSHYRLPISIPYLDQIFLFPKDHRRHHMKYGGPYGVTLSLFDTLFNTRDDHKK